MRNMEELEIEVGDVVHVIFKPDWEDRYFSHTPEEELMAHDFIGVDYINSYIKLKRDSIARVKVTREFEWKTET